MEWHEIIAAIAPAANRVLMFGPPGTGKSTAAARAGFGAALRGGKPAPVYRFSLTEDTSAVDLRGHWIMTADGMVWHDGPAIAAMVSGGVLVLDEIDCAGGDVEVFLHSICENSPSVTLPSGRTVTAAPGFAVIATMNTNPDTLRPALLDRFPVRLECKEYHPELLARLPTAAANILAGTDAGTEDRAMSARAWLAYLSLAQHVDAAIAGIAVFGEDRWETLADSIAAAELRPTTENVNGKE